MKVILFTKEDCALCEEAADMLRRLQQSIRFDLQLVYIADDPDLVARYGERVPVLVIDDREAAQAPLDEIRLVSILSAASG